MNDVHKLLKGAGNEMKEKVLSRVGRNIQRLYHGLSNARVKKGGIGLSFSKNSEYYGKPTSRKKRTLSSSFITVDRDHSYLAVNSKRDETPPTGRYHPEYKQIEKRPFSLKFTPLKPRSEQSTEEEKVVQDPDNKNNSSCFKVKPAIRFSLQVGRNQMRNSVLRNTGFTAHEERFGYMPTNEIGRKPSPPPFNKSRPRNNLMILKNMTLIDHYFENETIKRLRKKGMVEMKRMQKRPKVYSERPFIVPEWYPKKSIEMGYTKLGHSKRISVPQLHKMSARDNKMYYINESMNLNDKNEAAKYKHVYKAVQKERWKSCAKKSYSICY